MRSGTHAALLARAQQASEETHPSGAPTRIAVLAQFALLVHRIANRSSPKHGSRTPRR